MARPEFELGRAHPDNRQRQAATEADLLVILLPTKLSRNLLRVDKKWTIVQQDLPESSEVKLHPSAPYCDDELSTLKAGVKSSGSGALASSGIGIAMAKR